MTLKHKANLNFKFLFDNHPEGGMLNAAKISDLVEGSFWVMGSVSENREDTSNCKGTWNKTEVNFISIWRDFLWLKVKNYQVS